MLLTLADFSDPHPLIRTIILLTVFAFFLALVGAAIYTRYRRHVEISSRLKSMDDTSDRFSWPPNPPVSK